MINVQNKKCIHKLAIRSFKENKTRNLIAAIAIVLTTVLFTSLFTVGFGMVESVQLGLMRQAGGSAHASLKYLSQEEYDILSTHPLIKDIEYSILVAMAENEEFLKHHTEIWYSTEGDAEWNFCIPTSGRLPSKENEIATDTMVLDLLDIPHELGQKVKLNYTVNGVEYNTEFILSGFWDADEISSSSRILVSRAYIEKTFKGIEQNFKDSFNPAGTITANIKFKNSSNIEQKIITVINEKGYSVDDDAENQIFYGVNWSYLSTNFSMDATTIISAILGLFLIMFTGYLIIYNIFQISVVKDIKYYGLLKTIGTTSKQIKIIILRQALILSFIGIPFGLVIGFIFGKSMLPLVMNTSNYKNISTVSLNPLIFICSGLFALITVFVSCRKPGKIAAKVSPIEAVKYTGVIDDLKDRAKKSTDGAKLHRMALSNLKRNRKRTIIAIISMSLSLVLLNSVFTVTNGFNLDKFISNFVQTDFVIGHANYFNTNHFNFEEDELSQNFIESVKEQLGFVNGGKIYSKLGSKYADYNGEERHLQLYGLEDFPLSQLDIVDGQIDMEKLKSGKYIIEGVHDDDNGNIIWDTSNYSIGEKAKLYIDGKLHEYEVMAKCRIKYTNYVRYRFVPEVVAYITAEEFYNIEEKPIVMNYQFNVNDDHIDNMEEFIRNYTQNIEPSMNYSSRISFEEEFEGLQRMFLIVGGALSLIIGLIGILNFINSILTSIIARRQEFAMLQSIGMTNKQLRKLLSYEGFSYAMGTIGFSLLLGTFFSLVIVNGVVGKLWFFSYRFIIWPMLVSYPILIIVSMIIPYAAYVGVNKQSIVERLREVE